MKKFFSVKFSLTKKIIIVFLILLFFQVIATSLFSYFIFQRLLDEQVSIVDIKTDLIKSQIEKYYEKSSSVIKLPELRWELYENIEDTKRIKEEFEKRYPEFVFNINTIQGVVEYKEKPALVYDSDNRNFAIQLTREIQFKKKLPFESLELTMKLNFFMIILKSLLFGSLLATLVLIPFIILYLRSIIYPITKVSQGATRIASGELGVQVTYKSNDEIGLLANSFNSMSLELSKIKKIRDDLLATVSHELRTPLSRIRGYTELLLDLQLDKNEQNNYYDSILQEIDLLNNMAGEIIEISRIELKKQQMIFSNIDISEFFDSLKEEYSTFFNSHKCSFKFDILSGINCSIDIDKFKRVIINAITNAINADATEICINTEKTNDNLLRISIIDNGIGIKEEYFQLVFEKFYRIDKSRDRKTGGFGLGLAICKGIIEEHNGNIYFTKSSNGTCLVIDLPVIQIKSSKP